MPGKKRVWTEAEDASLRELLDQGGSTIDAAARFGCCRQHALAHAKAIGAVKPRTPYVKPRSNASLYYDDPLPAWRKDWWPLPAGHPVPWRAITAGTVLDGQEYPQ